MFYGLFEKRGNRWHKIHARTYPLHTANRVFKRHVIAGIILGKERSIKKVAPPSKQDKEEGPVSFINMVESAVKRNKVLVLNGRYVTVQTSMDPNDIHMQYIVEYYTEDPL